MDNESGIDSLFDELEQLAIKISKKKIIIKERNKRLEIISNKDLPPVTQNYNRLLTAYNKEKAVYDKLHLEVNHIKQCLIKENLEIEDLLELQMFLKNKIKVKLKLIT